MLFILTFAFLLLPFVFFSGAAEIIAQQDANGNAHAVAQGRTKMQLPDGAESRFVQPKASPAHNLHAGNFTARVYFQLNVNGGFRFGACGCLRIDGAQATKGLRQS
jgi:hypothetical protein